MKRQFGFTLIELMIVVVIIGLLLSVALPSYQDHLRKGRRSDAQSYMMDLAQREQQYFTDNRTYATGNGAAAALNASTPSSVVPYYTFAIAQGNANGSGNTPPSFTITATAINSQAADGNLSLDNLGTKTPSTLW